MAQKTRKFWGWGVAEDDLSDEAKTGMARMLSERYGLGELTPVVPPRIEEMHLRAPRVSPPESLVDICSASPLERAGHAMGKDMGDVVRALERKCPHPPDFVAFPRNENEIVRLLDWCTDNNVAAVPYGGGSTVVGGVEPDVGDGYAGAISIDMGKLDQVLEIDHTSRAAHIQGGIYGPALEAQLKPHGLTLRHFPQSFEFSTLGGWIATRSGGHYATLHTHIDDFVESLRVITPAGSMESRRLPGSGAGPSPDRMFIGSEGALGIITSAWMRLQNRPTFRANATVTFPDFLSAAQAVRALSQSGLYPANCRILDPAQAQMSMVGDGTQAVLILGFESADHNLDPWMKRGLECCADHKGAFEAGAGVTTEDAIVTRSGKAGQWRDNFLSGPYIRDAMVSMGIISFTFETAITWDRWENFHQNVMETATKAVNRVCGGGIVACRFTHAYPDGPAPYYTIAAPGKWGSMISQWHDIRQEACDEVIRQGGTITHHHSVGRAHRPWYDQQRPEVFAQALTATKKALDPAGIMNPGVLIDPA